MTPQDKILLAMAALERAQGMFEFYSHNHRAKNPPQFDKAAVNAVEALACQSVLAVLRIPDPEPAPAAGAPSESNNGQRGDATVPAAGIPQFLGFDVPPNGPRAILDFKRTEDDPAPEKGMLRWRFPNGEVRLVTEEERVLLNNRLELLERILDGSAIQRDKSGAYTIKLKGGEAIGQQLARADQTV